MWRKGALTAGVCSLLLGLGGILSGQWVVYRYGSPISVVALLVVGIFLTCAAFFSQETDVDDYEGPPTKDTFITLFGHDEEKEDVKADSRPPQGKDRCP